MAVYQDFGPGIGAGIDAFFENQMRRKLFDLQTQGMQDEHNARQAEMIANYGYEPPTSSATPIPQNQSFLGKIHDRIFGVPAQPASSPSGDVAPVAPPVDNGAFRSMIANMSGTAGAASALPITTTPGAPKRNAVMPVDQVTNPGDLFTRNLTASFQNAALTGQRTPAAATMSRAGAGAGNIPGNPNAGNSGGAQRTVADAQDDFLSSLENAPRVTLANGGTIQPYAGLIRQLRMKQAEADIDAGKTVRVSDLTGATDEHAANAALARRRGAVPMLGDADYNTAKAGEAAATAGAAAAATMPYDIDKMVAQGQISRANGVALENLRAQHELARQQDEQAFQRGQLTKEQVFQRQQARDQREGDFLNSIGLAQFNDTRKFMPGIVQSIKGWDGKDTPAPTVAPSDLVGGQTITINGRTYRLTAPE